MRIFSVVFALIFAFTASAVTASAQKGKGKEGKGKEPDKKTTKDEKQKEPPPVTDVGGKNVQEWIAAIRSEDRSLGATALQTVLMFGPEKAKAAIPEILKELKRHRPPSFSVDPAFLVNAPNTLTKILVSLASMKKADAKEIDETIKVFKTLLHDPQIVVRYHVLQVLPFFGPSAKETIPDLIALTRKATSPSYETRKMAVLALGAVAQPTEKGKDPDAKVIAALFAAVKSTNEKSSQVRMAALNSLLALRVPEQAGLKGQFETAIEPVAKSDPDKILRIHAHMSLYKLNTKVKPETRRKVLAQMLSGKLKDKEIAVRVEAARALGLLGKDALDQQAALIDAVDDKEGIVGAAAVWSLANIGRKNAPMKQILAQFTQTHPTPEVRVEFCKAIAGMAPDTRDLIPTLLQVAYKDKEPGVRVAAILAVGGFGLDALRDVPALEKIGADKTQPEPVQLAAKGIAEQLVELKKLKDKESKKGASE
jgi:HEAT repeat protein